VLLGLTLLAILFLSIRMFLGAKNPEVSTGSSVNMENLEVTLKQLLEKAGQVPTASTVAAAGGSEDSQRLLTEITNLKTDLQEKQKQIEVLKTAPATSAAGGAGMSSDEKNQMEAQLRELQAKLSEYEIISEDIADLSFYKEQNAKLQKELDAVKGGAGATASKAAPTPAPAPSAPPPPVEVEAASVAAPEPAVARAEPEIVGRSSSSSPAEIPSEVAAAPEVPTPVTPAAPAASAAAEEAVDTSVDDDLMAEFAAAVEKQKALNPDGSAPASDAANVDLGQMDMDKMMAEAAVIKTDVPEIDPSKALGTGLDENKLLQEAAALDSVTSEDKKLMGDFENFVKKSES